MQELQWLNEFQVRACDRHGLWNEAPARFGIVLAPYWWQMGWVQAAGAAGGSLGIAMWGFWLVERTKRRKEAEAETALDRKDLEHLARINEQRALLGADLHDDAGSMLARVKRLSDQARREMPDPRLEHISQAAKEALEGFDQTVWLLKPGGMTLDKLALRLIHTAERTIEDTGIRSCWDVPSGLAPVALTPAFARDLLLFVKEAFTNIVKHSRAKEARLRVVINNSTLCVRIEDDGCGFEISAVPKDRSGLTNLRNRAHRLGGSVLIDSTPARGTVITLTITLAGLSSVLS